MVNISRPIPGAGGARHVLPGLASDVLFSMRVASAKLLQAEKAKNSCFPQNWL
jgi:hypothetical protein